MAVLVQSRSCTNEADEYSLDCLLLLDLFCLPLGSLSRPFWHPLAFFRLPFGSLRLLLASLLLLFGTPWLLLGFLAVVLGTRRTSSPAEAKFRRDLAKILPRFCRERAENLQEPAENLPYEPQEKLPFTLQLLRKDVVRRQTLPQNRLK